MKKFGDFIIIKIFEKIISKIKGSPYVIDKNITIFELLRSLQIRFNMLLRGTFAKIFLKGNGLVFKGKKSKIICANRVKLHGTSTFSDNSYIDARVSEEISLGNNFSLGMNSVIEGFGVLSDLGTALIVGDNVGIAPNSFISIRGKIIIGNDVIIGPYFSLHPENHNFDKDNLSIREQGTSRMGIVINDNVWIGAKVTILDNVTVNSGSVIAAGSVVTKDVPKNAVVAGVPAKIIKYRI
jgi:acetyltransferase-like isoleucine patch superfamily enzyme